MSFTPLLPRKCKQHLFMGTMNEVLIVLKSGLRKYGLLVNYSDATEEKEKTTVYHFVSSDKIRAYKTTGDKKLIDAIADNSIAYIDTNLRF